MEEVIKTDVDLGNVIFITASGKKYFAPVSVVSVPEPEPTPAPLPVPNGRKVWIDEAALTQILSTGAAWDKLLSIAKTSTFPTPSIANQDSTHTRYVLAAALAGKILKDTGLIEKAKAGLTAAIGTEAGGRWLAIGRNLGAYIIAADVLGIQSGPIYDWLKKFHDGSLKLNHDNTGADVILKQVAWDSGSNASAQEGFVYTALCAFFKDKTGLDYNWDCLKRYLGDTTATHKLVSNQFGDPWQIDNTDQGRVGILPTGAVKNSLNIDGAVANDMGRSNPKPVNPLVYKSESLYPWVGLNGAGFAALVLHRQGYKAFEHQNQALLRAFKFLRRIAVDQKDERWWGSDKKEDVKFLLIQAYNLKIADYPTLLPIGIHDLVGFTDVTHANGV